MTYSIKVASRKAFESDELLEMHRLRARIFKDRMGWEVPAANGLEIDEYDALDPYYMMIRESGKVLRGCWRVLPTEGPYMLRNTFPQLLYDHPAPKARHIWELSRFAIDADGPQGFGFSGLALAALREIVEFGDRMNIERYVTVTTPSIERLMRRAELAVTRYGAPIRVGVEYAVALDFDIGDQTHEVLFGKMSKAAA